MESKSKQIIVKLTSDGNTALKIAKKLKIIGEIKNTG